MESVSPAVSRAVRSARVLLCGFGDTWQTTLKWPCPLHLYHVGRIVSAHNVGWAKMERTVLQWSASFSSACHKAALMGWLPEPHREPCKRKLGDKQITGNIRFGLVILERTVFCQWHIRAVGKAPRAYNSKWLKLHNWVQTSFRGDLRIVCQLRGDSVHVELLPSQTIAFGTPYWWVPISPWAVNVFDPKSLSFGYSRNLKVN